MATLTVQTVSRTAKDLVADSVAAAAGGDTIPNTGVEFLYIQNLSGSDKTLTVAFDSAVSVDGVDPANKTYVIADGEKKLIGPFPVAFYGANVALTYSSHTSVKVAALKLSTT